MNTTYEVFSGFAHKALQETRLTPCSKGLQVSTKTGSLDLRIDVGAVQGIIPEMELDPWQLADGASLRSVTHGTVDGAEQETASLTFERQGRGLALTPDFRAIGAETYELILFREGQIVWRQPGNSGVAGAFNNFTAGRRRACCRVVIYSFGNTVVAPFTLTDGPQIDADNVFFVPEHGRRQVTSLNALTLTGSGIEALTLTSTSVAVVDPFVTYRGLGEAVVTLDGRAIEVELDGDRSGGVAVACGDVDRCQLNLAAHHCGASKLVNLTASPGAGVFRSQLELGNGQNRYLDLDAISGPDAELRLDLPDNSKIVLSDERIMAAERAPGTMRAVQATLRSRA